MSADTPERVFEALLLEHLDEKRRRWRDLDIEAALYVEGQDWATRYRKAAERAIKEARCEHA